MNNGISSCLFYLAGLFLMISGITQMFVRAQSEAEAEGMGGGSLIAEIIRSNGCQSFGIGIACIALGTMPGARRIQEHSQLIEEKQPQSFLIPNQETKAPGKTSLFTDSEWNAILKIVEELGIEPSQASMPMSYMTSSRTAVICNSSKSTLATIEKTAGAGWKPKS